MGRRFRRLTSTQNVARMKNQSLAPIVNNLENDGADVLRARSLAPLVRTRELRDDKLDAWCQMHLPRRGHLLKAAVQIAVRIEARIVRMNVGSIAIGPVIVVVSILIGHLAVLVLHVFGAANVLIEIVGPLVEILVIAGSV